MRLMTRLRALRNDCAGSMPIEGLLGGLLILGWYAIAFQFYDAFRMKSITTRASYTVGDLISRERDGIGPAYVAGLKKVFDYLSNSYITNQSWMRVTLLSCIATDTNTDACDGVHKDFTVTKSYATNSIPVQTTTTIKGETDRIPIMGAGDMAVIVETSYFYVPLLALGDRSMMLDGTIWTHIGLSSSIRFSNFVVTRPRGPRVVWDDSK